MSNCDFAWPSGKELEVLRILQGTPGGMYGLEIVEKSDGTVGRASIYVLLGRLEEKGFVKIIKRTDSHPGMPRPIYSITADGRKVLDAAESLALSRARA